MPAYDLLKFNLYSEPFMPKPFALIQTARGCPYQCNFCVKSFGTQLGLRKAEDILDEIEYLVREHGVKAIRFIDDTFTAIPSRVHEICHGIIERKLKVSWTCLSRLDTLDEEMIGTMYASGCVRLNVGIESGSPRMLEKYNKQLDLERGKNMLLHCSSIGLETLGFFMVGHPDETEEELQMSIDFAKTAKLNFAVVGELIPYAGTKLFDELGDKLEFSLFPYVNRFKDSETELKYLNWEKRFYRDFYMRPSYVLNHLRTQVIRGRSGWSMLKEVLRFLYSKSPVSLRRDFI
jgi:anaerobic magnesium-protoporphyrin IX monomethyl ester cyclase